MDRAEALQDLAAAIRRLLGPDVVVRQDSETQALLLRRGSPSAPPTLILDVREASAPAADLDRSAALGAEQLIVLTPQCPVPLRVWDRLAWEWEERDVADPASCDTLSLVVSTDRGANGERIVVLENVAAGAKAGVAIRQR